MTHNFTYLCIVHNISCVCTCIIRTCTKSIVSNAVIQQWRHPKVAASLNSMKSVCHISKNMIHRLSKMITKLCLLCLFFVTLTSGLKCCHQEFVTKGNECMTEIECEGSCATQKTIGKSCIYLIPIRYLEEFHRT